MNDHESIIIMDYYVILIILLKFILIRDGKQSLHWDNYYSLEVSVTFFKGRKHYPLKGLIIDLLNHLRK